MAVRGVGRVVWPRTVRNSRDGPNADTFTFGDGAYDGRSDPARASIWTSLLMWMRAYPWPDLGTVLVAGGPGTSEPFRKGDQPSGTWQGRRSSLEPD